MSWINIPKESDWGPRIVDVRPRISDPETGQVDQIMAVHSADAGSLLAHLNLYEQAMQESPAVPKLEREMIGVAVSTTNGCHY